MTDEKERLLADLEVIAASIQDPAKRQAPRGPEDYCPAVAPSPGVAGRGGDDAPALEVV